MGKKSVEKKHVGKKGSNHVKDETHVNDELTTVELEEYVENRKRARLEEGVGRK